MIIFLNSGCPQRGLDRKVANHMDMGISIKSINFYFHLVIFKAFGKDN